MDTMRKRIVRGDGILDDLGPALDDLLRAVGAPVTARRPWLQSWVDSYRDHQPWAITVTSDGELTAAALLAAHRRSAHVEVVGLGHGPSDLARLPARDRASAEALAAAVEEALGGLEEPWTLRIEQLPTDDAVAAAVRERFPNSALVPGDDSPIARFGENRDPHAHIAKSVRSSVRRCWNRLGRERHEVELSYERGAAEIAALLPEVERVHRARDAALGRRSDLDAPNAARFWRDAIGTHAARGEVEVTAMRVDGRLAAYVVGLLDGDVYRMWDGRFEPDLAPYSPGKLSFDATLRRVIADGGFVAFDWMRGLEAYKLRMSNDVVPAQHLVAWSSPLLRAKVETPRRMKLALKAVKDRHEPLERAWRFVKRNLPANTPL